MKENWKLIFLLVIALGVIIAYAFVPAVVADRMPFRQASMSAICDEAVADDAAIDTLSENSTEKEPVDTAMQRILLFGDSMSQPLALRLSDWANKNGHTLTCVTWFSSSTKWWAAGDTIRHYIRKVNPTHVFICLGSNELYTNDEQNTVKNINTILQKVGNIPTIWIGPPNWCEDKGFNKWLLRVMGPKRYYPSYKLTFERQKDGRHPNMKSSSMWMDKVIEWMNEGHSIHPFVMEKPDKQDRHYRQYVLPLPGEVKRAIEKSKNSETKTDEENSLEETTPTQPALDKPTDKPAEKHADKHVDNAIPAESKEAAHAE